MLRWYKITCNSIDATGNVLKSLRQQRLMVREHNHSLFACVSTHHQQWLYNVCRDFGAKMLALDEPPTGIRAPTSEVYKAPCGEEFFDPILYSHHFRQCQKCKEISSRDKPIPEKEKEVVKDKMVIAKLEPGQNFDLNGVIASLEIIRDKAWERLESLDNLLSNLKCYRDAKDNLTKLDSEIKSRVDAVRLLLRDGKL